MDKCLSPTLYWLGNAAKSRVIREILAQIDPENQTLIFDYGCGDAGDWPSILSDYSNIKLIAYEPDVKRFEKAHQRLQGFNAEVISGNDLATMSFQADFIVSFSVLEHVYDRLQYLQTAKRHLAESGLFYLNYDDGHFRNFLNLNQPSLWFPELKEWLHNLLAKPLADMGMIFLFQKRVNRDDIDVTISQVGFRIIEAFYSNLASFKSLSKDISPEKQIAFCKFWLEVEESLNTKFVEETEIVLEDRVNLWKQMGSRTLVLGCI